MSLEAEILADRHRLKRKLTFWRIGGLAILALFVIGLIAEAAGLAEKGKEKDHIARVRIEGVITDDQKLQKMLKKIAKSDHAKAVILRINSPGGTTTGGEAIYESLISLKEKKPVVAVFGTVAASAAYMIAMSSDHIVARGNTITGSVGVIFQWAEVSDLLKNFGVKVEEIKSGKLKATPSPFKPADEGGLQVAREMVDDSFEWFIDLVAKQRKIKPEDVPGLREGRIYSGRQGVKYRLVDEIGGETEAVTWLEKNKDIEEDLPVVEWKPKKESRLSLLTSLVHGVGKVTGLDPSGILAVMSLDSVRGRLELNGLVSMWQPSSDR